MQDLSIFEDFTDIPYFESMEAVEAVVGPVWVAYHEEAKRLVACGKTGDDKDEEKQVLMDMLTIVRRMIGECEDKLKKCFTEEEAKVQFAMLCVLQGRRRKLEDAVYSALVVGSMMYQADGETKYSWLS